MRPLLLKNLFLSSSLLLLLHSCSPAFGYKFRGRSVITEEQVRPVINKANSLLYKARIKVFNKTYSGLILLKQLNPGTAHLTFVTEIGMKMFDFEIQDNQLKLVYIFEPLNKPRIIQLLSSDMKLILLQDLLNKEASVYEKGSGCVYKIKNGENYYFKSDTTSHTISKTIVKGALFTKRKVTYSYEHSDPSQIKLKHKGLIRVKIRLTKLNQTTP